MYYHFRKRLPFFVTTKSAKVIQIVKTNKTVKIAKSVEMMKILKSNKSEKMQKLLNLLYLAQWFGITANICFRINAKMSWDIRISVYCKCSFDKYCRFNNFCIFSDSLDWEIFIISALFTTFTVLSVWRIFMISALFVVTKKGKRFRKW